MGALGWDRARWRAHVAQRPWVGCTGAMDAAPRQAGPRIAQARGRDAENRLSEIRWRADLRQDLIGLRVQYQPRGGSTVTFEASRSHDSRQRKSGLVRRAGAALLSRGRVRIRRRWCISGRGKAAADQCAELRALQDMRYQGSAAEYSLGDARGRRRTELSEHVAAPSRAKANDFGGYNATLKSHPVLARTSSMVTPGCSSVNARPAGPTSKTQRSVMIMFTTDLPVMGRLHCLSILGEPSRAVCSIRTITRRTPETKSIAPPGPLTIFPGTIQFARSPFSATSSAPRIDRSMWPPRIIANDCAREKKLDPGRVVMVCLPALMRSGSTWSSAGNGPMPSNPFSDCSVTVMSFGMKLATSVGMPMPRLT